jgi:polar amino acid transport system permease protein
MPSSGFRLIAENMPLLLSGLANTLLVAVSALVIGTVGGIGFGALRLSRRKGLAIASRAILETFRVVPLMVMLLVGYFAVPRLLGSSVSGEAVAIVVFSLWGSVEMGELVRGAFQSLPVSVRESAFALALTNWQVFFLIELPLALRRLLPGAINLATRMIKTTSLIVLVGSVDVIKRGQQIIERTKQSFPIYAFLFALFFALCWPLTALAARLTKAKGARFDNDTKDGR